MGKTHAVALLVLLSLSVGAVAVAYDPKAAQSPFADEPALTPTPRAECGPGSRPETGIQGRVSPDDHASGRAAKGFTCNTELVGQYTKPNAQGTVGGFKVERYVDAAGHDCAYYDTTLMWPTNALDQEGGVNVLDMADPAHPALTARLLTPAMDTPHESLVLSQSRGLLVAVAGNLATNVGQIDVYDVSKDCRNREFRSTTRSGCSATRAGCRRTARRSTRRRPPAKRSWRWTSRIPRCRGRSGSGTTTRMACRSAPTGTAPSGTR